MEREAGAKSESKVRREAVKIGVGRRIKSCEYDHLHSDDGHHEGVLGGELCRGACGILLIRINFDVIRIWIVAVSRKSRAVGTRTNAYARVLL